MTCLDIQQILMEVLYENHPYLCKNYSGLGFGECDLLAISKSHISKEYEIKISRSDFKKDFEKTFKHHKMNSCMNGPDRITYQGTTPNQFYFVCPERLLMPHEMPDYAGLVWVTDTEVKEVKSAPMLHRKKASFDLITSLCRSAIAKYVFGTAYMTFLNNRGRKKWKKVKELIPTVLLCLVSVFSFAQQPVKLRETYVKSEWKQSPLVDPPHNFKGTFNKKDGSIRLTWERERDPVNWQILVSSGDSLNYYEPVITADFHGAKRSIEFYVPVEYAPFYFKIRAVELESLSAFASVVVGQIKDEVTVSRSYLDSLNKKVEFYYEKSKHKEEQVNQLLKDYKDLFEAYLVGCRMCEEYEKIHQKNKKNK